jgi:hypothetical protein
LQQSCAAADVNAVKATAMTNSATVAIIVFLFKVFLLIAFNPRNTTRRAREAAKEQAMTVRPFCAFHRRERAPLKKRGAGSREEAAIVAGRYLRQNGFEG